MTTLQSRIAGAVMAIALGGGFFVGTALADTVTQITSVGLAQNPGGQECALGLVVERGFALDTAHVKDITLIIVNSKSNRICHVDVRGTALTSEGNAVPIHDLKLEESNGSAVAVETVAEVPDLAVPEVPAWLIASTTDGQRAVIKATLSRDHLAHLPAGIYTGLLTLTGSANAP